MCRRLHHRVDVHPGFRKHATRSHRLSSPSLEVSKTRRPSIYSYHHASSAPEFPLVVTPLTFELQPASAHTHFKSMYNICNSINLHYKPITIKVPIEGSSQGKRLHNFPMNS